MQTEPQSSQAINKGFGVEVMKPYDTPIGEPVRTMVMTEKFYNEQPRRSPRSSCSCFVRGHQGLHRRPGAGREIRARDVFKGQITRTISTTRIGNSPYTYDITRRAHPDHHRHDGQVRRRARWRTPPVAEDWVKTDLLDEAKKALGVK